MDKSLQDKLLRAFPNTEFSGIKREYDTGRSGSPVFAVKFKPKNTYGLNGTFIVKIGSESWATDEQAFYNHPTTDALTPLLARPHMPSLPIEGQVAVAYDVAFGSLIEPQPLMSILDEGSQSEGEAQRQIRDLSRALVDWYLGSDISRNSVVSDPHTLLFQMLTPKRTDDMVEKLGKALPFWEPDALQISVEGLNRRLPNPLAYMQKGTWSKIQYNPNCPIGRIHGDLHTGNIICLPKAKNLPKVIDFGQSVPDGVPFFDLAYLEFDIMQHLLSVEQVEDRTQWLSLLDFSMARIVRKQQKMTWDAARAWKFIQPIRQQVKRLQAVDSEDYEIVWWLSTVAVGLNFARKGDHTRSPFERMAGLLYAAYGLARILDMLHVKELITGHAPFIPWIQEKFSPPSSSELPPSAVSPDTPHENTYEPDKSRQVSTGGSTQPALEETRMGTSEAVSNKVHQPVRYEQGRSAVQGLITKRSDDVSIPPKEVDNLMVSDRSEQEKTSEPDNATYGSDAKAKDIQEMLQNASDRFNAGGIIYQDVCDTCDLALQKVGDFLQGLSQKFAQYDYEIRVPLNNAIELQKKLRAALHVFRDSCPPLNTKKVPRSRYDDERTAISSKLEDLLANFLELVKKLERSNMLQ
jgi:hypothetical protein